MPSYRSVEIFFHLLVSPLGFFFFIFWGNGRGGNGKVKSLDWQALAFRSRRVKDDSISGIASNGQRKKKKIQVQASLNHPR
ncbi:hypothetical protein V8C37DRAFT_105756 [Trichoderma ceciliae]